MDIRKFNNDYYRFTDYQKRLFNSFTYGGYFNKVGDTWYYVSDTRNLHKISNRIMGKFIEMQLVTINSKQRNMAKLSPKNYYGYVNNNNLWLVIQAYSFNQAVFVFNRIFHTDKAFQHTTHFDFFIYRYAKNPLDNTCLATPIESASSYTDAVELTNDIISDTNLNFIFDKNKSSFFINDNLSYRIALAPFNTTFNQPSAVSSFEDLPPLAYTAFS